MQDPAQNTPTAQAPGIAPWLVYILYIVSLFIGLTAVIGVIAAYMQRSNAPEWLQNHYRFQINTFWIGLLAFLAAVITLPLYGVGMLIGALLTIWLLARCIYGMRQLSAHEPIPNPEAWLFGWHR